MFRLKASHLQASTILCQMLLPTLGSQSVYIYYLMLFLEIITNEQSTYK